MSIKGKGVATKKLPITFHQLLAFPARKMNLTRDFAEHFAGPFASEPLIAPSI